jgi:GTP diphosphokinase / guanosine-3',5'-bis(diphosphate) 3'-diphosphatase
LAERGADSQMLCAAMLRDTTYDTPYTLAALSGQFGAPVAALVAGTIALDQVKGNLSQVLAAVRSADTRVLAIKVADRLHNMRTVEFIEHAKQLRKSRESLDIIAPVACQLSMDTIGAGPSSRWTSRDPPAGPTRSRPTSAGSRARLAR